MNGARTLAVDTMCVAYVLANLHTRINIEQHKMQRGKLVEELKAQISERGSALPDELLGALDACLKSDFVPIAEEKKEGGPPAKRRRR